MSKHTPGPWQYVMRNMNDLMQTYHGVRAGSFYFDIPTSNEQADAQLIAAAPDLLAALIDCVLVMQRELSGLEVIQPELRQAESAIAKARGEA